MVAQIKSLQELQEKLANADDNKLVVVNFYAAWSEDSIAMSSTIKNLSCEYADAEFYDVDVNEDETIATEYKIDKMPMITFFKNGEQVDVLDDASVDKLKTLLEKYH